MPTRPPKEAELFAKKAPVTYSDCAVKAGKYSTEELKLTGRLIPSKTRFCWKLLPEEKQLNRATAQINASIFIKRYCVSALLCRNLIGEVVYYNKTNAFVSFVGDSEQGRRRKEGRRNLS